jgi:hypothetical protein
MADCAICERFCDSATEPGRHCTGTNTDCGVCPKCCRCQFESHLNDTGARDPSRFDFEWCERCVPERADMFASIAWTLRVMEEVDAAPEKPKESSDGSVIEGAAAGRLFWKHEMMPPTPDYYRQALEAALAKAP